jgi:phosphoribosylformylglycinamidine synthase
LLFSESPSRIVLSAAQTNVEQIMAVADEQGVAAAVIGRTGGERLVIEVNRQGVIDRIVAEVESAWRNSLRYRLEVAPMAAD